LTLERVADEDTAGSSPERRRALVQGLARTSWMMASAPAAGFKAMDGLDEGIAGLAGELTPLPRSPQAQLPAPFSLLRLTGSVGPFLAFLLLAGARRP